MNEQSHADNVYLSTHAYRALTFENRQKSHIVFPRLMRLISSKASNIDKDLSFDFLSEWRTVSRRSHNDVSKVSSVVQGWQVYLIKLFFDCICDQERLFKVGLKVVLHYVSANFSGSRLIDILQNISVYKGKVESILSLVKSHEARVCRKMHVLDLSFLLNRILGLRNRIVMKDVLSRRKKHKLDFLKNFVYLLFDHFD